MARKPGNRKVRTRSLNPQPMTIPLVVGPHIADHVNRLLEEMYTARFNNPSYRKMRELEWRRDKERRKHTRTTSNTYDGERT